MCAETKTRVSLRATSAGDGQARQLLRQSDELMGSLYPAASNHLESSEALQAPDTLFVGAFRGDAMVGCGAVKILRADCVYGEVKRMFVLPEERGRGVATEILLFLENHLRKSGIGTARLETGVKQTNAIRLYAKLGYVERPPFASYREDPLSVFMEKALVRASPR